MFYCFHKRESLSFHFVMILEATMDANGDLHVNFHDYETSDSEVSSIDEDHIEEGTCGIVFFLSVCICWLSKSCEECRSRSISRLARPRSRSRV